MVLHPASSARRAGACQTTCTGPIHRAAGPARVRSPAQAPAGKKDVTQSALSDHRPPVARVCASGAYPPAAAPSAAPESRDRAAAARHRDRGPRRQAARGAGEELADGHRAPRASRTHPAPGRVGPGFDQAPPPEACERVGLNFAGAYDVRAGHGERSGGWPWRALTAVPRGGGCAVSWGRPSATGKHELAAWPAEGDVGSRPPEDRVLDLAREREVLVGDPAGRVRRQLRLGARPRSRSSRRDDRPPHIYN